MESKYIRKNRIAEALSLRGMRQAELCERTGIKKSSINGWVKNNWQPKQDPLYKMAQVLEVSEMWLAGYDVPMERPPMDYIVSDGKGLHIVEIKDSKTERLNRLFEYITELSTDQIDAVETMVNQLHKLSEKD